MIFKACAIALISVFCAVILRELGWRGAGVVVTLCLVILFSFLSEGIAAGVKEIEYLSSISGVSDFGKSVLKIIGIGYIYGMSADICNDMDYRAVASALSTLGRVEILITVLPYFKDIIGLGLRLFG